MVHRSLVISLWKQDPVADSSACADMNKKVNITKFLKVPGAYEIC